MLRPFVKRSRKMDLLLEPSVRFPDETIWRRSLTNCRRWSNQVKFFFFLIHSLANSCVMVFLERPTCLKNTLWNIVESLFMSWIYALISDLSTRLEEHLLINKRASPSKMTLLYPWSKLVCTATRHVRIPRWKLKPPCLWEANAWLESSLSNHEPPLRSLSDVRFQ